MIPEPSLYTGTLRHRRFRPREHQFTYKLFMAWLDIDHIPELMAKLPWTGYNHFNWASFHQRDHFGDPSLNLRERLTADAREHGVDLPDGPIFLLTHLRYAGYCFNPISFFFCYGQSGTLKKILAEVNSTFGESRNYWLGPENQVAAMRYRCPKTMHVSPFMAMDMDYEFVLTRPEEKVVAHMNVSEQSDRETRLFDATLSLERQDWTAGNVGRALLRHPWMTAKVTAAIHWEALRLWVKKVPVHTHPARIQEVSKHP